jgi:ribosomal protein L36
MPGYNSQRRGTARTLPKFLCCSKYCLFCIVLCIVCVLMCTVLLSLGVNPIAVNRFIISIISSKRVTRERTKFDTEYKSSKFFLEIMTLVSSANNICSDTEFILRRSFVCVMNNRDPRIDPRGIPCFSVPQSEKIF